MQPAEWYKERVFRPSLSEADKAFVRQDWEQLTGASFHTSFSPGCPNCYNDAILLILRVMNKSDKGGYELKAGASFRYKGKVYTRQNITPEAAEWWIKQDINHRDEFVTLAHDYDSYETSPTKDVE